MTFLELFIQGWKTIWKSKLIWLFTLIIYAGYFIILPGRRFSIPIVCFLLLLMILTIFLGGMGLVLTVYGVIKDDHPSLINIWHSIKKYWADYLLSSFYAFWLSLFVSVGILFLELAVIYLFIVPAININRSNLMLYAIYSAIGIFVITLPFLTSIFFCSVIDQQLKISEAIHQGWVLIKRNRIKILGIIIVFWIAILLTMTVVWFFPWLRYLTQVLNFIINPLMVAVFVLAYLKFAERESAPQTVGTIGSDEPYSPPPSLRSPP
jgi:hypothetical protein